MTPEEARAAAAETVATWPALTPERAAHLRRLLKPSADRLRARLAADAEAAMSPRRSA